MHTKQAKSRIIFILIFLSACAHSQEVKEQQPKDWIFKIDAPLLLDGFSFPTLQLSAERKITPEFSLIGEFGIQLYGAVSDTTKLKTRGFKVNLEGRYYLARLFNSDRIRKHTGLFCGLQPFYRQNQGTYSIDYHKPDSNVSFTDEFGVKKKAYGLHITMGYQLLKTKFRVRYIIEPHIGIGLMNKEVRNYDLNYNYSVDINENHHNLSGDADFESSSGVRLSVNVGMRIGFF